MQELKEPGDLTPGSRIHDPSDIKDHDANCYQRGPARSSIVDVTGVSRDRAYLPMIHGVGVCSGSFNRRVGDCSELTGLRDEFDDYMLQWVNTSGEVHATGRTQIKDEFENGFRPIRENRPSE
jgi:hypothetical protein